MAKNRKKAARQEEKPPTPLLDISEQDQWRIIRESGILQKLPTDTAAQPAAAEEPLLSPLTEEIFAALALIIPHASLLLLFEMYVRFHVYPALAHSDIQIGTLPVW